MLRAAALLAAVAAVLAGAAPADAGTAVFTPAHQETVPPDCAGKCGGPTTIQVPERLDYVAAAGEANRIVVTREGVTWTVADEAGASLGPGAEQRCSAVDATTVRCQLAFSSVAAGDGDDEVRVPDGPPVDGGDGTDRLWGGSLQGGAGDDFLTGTPELDGLDGGAGADTIDAGPGDDTIAGQADPGPGDVVDGGDGRDTMSYAQSKAGVRIDLLAPVASEDDLRRIEAVGGSNYRDELRGTDGPDVLNGGAASDLLDARGGDDVLQVSGAGVIRAGDGNDRIDLTTGLYDAFVDAGAGDDRITGLIATTLLRCGPGTDVAERNLGVYEGALIGGDCETGKGRASYPDADRGKVRTGVFCPGPAVGVTACRASARLLDRGGRVIARAQHTFSPDGLPGGGPMVGGETSTRSKGFALRLDRRARARLRRGRRIRATVEVVRTATIDGVESSDRGTARITLGRSALRRR